MTFPRYDSDSKIKLCQNFAKNPTYPKNTSKSRGVGVQHPPHPHTPPLVTSLPLGGCSYRFAAVRSSVRPFVGPFVSYQLSSETNHRISLIFCIKLAFNKSKKLTIALVIVISIPSLNAIL